MSPLERAARGMYEHVRKKFPKATCEWEEMGEPTRETYVSGVRAAIQAIREPTAGMIKAANHMTGFSLEDAYIEQEWRAMIDALLDEGAGK